MKKREIKLLGCLIILPVLLLALCQGVRIYTLFQPTTSFPLNLRWQTDLGRSTHDYPVYQDDLLILPVNTLLSSYWYGIEADTGRVVWSQRDWWQRLGFRNYLRCSTRDYLVVSGPWGLTVFKTHTGDVIWENNRSHDSVTCNETTIFSSGTPSNSIQAFDLLTGQRRWTTTKPQQPFSGLIYNPEAESIIGTGSNGLSIVDPKSGQVDYSLNRWFIPPTGGTWERGGMYLIDHGQIFIGGTVLDANTLQVLHQEDHYHSRTPPTVSSDTIYISDALKGVVALDRNTFDVKWIYQPQRKLRWMPVFASSPVAILDGVGYALFSDVTLRAFNLENGQEMGHWQPGIFELWQGPSCEVFPSTFTCALIIGTGFHAARASLTVSEDTLFVSFGDGKLYAFGE